MADVVPNITIKARAEFIPNPAALLQEILDGGDEGSAALVRSHTMVLEATKVLTYKELDNAENPHATVAIAADEMRNTMVIEVLSKTGVINLTKEGEWPT